ncbi:histidinol-phosphatase HisJ [bacterium]|nr:histidinol-phosphatase HisJ [bacterium]
MIKWDGHSHSMFCRHGSGEDTGKMIEKAIELKFERYSITEHAPLPLEIFDDPELAADFALSMDELPDYFSHIKDLKKIYSDRIEILSGLELDYIIDYDSFFDDFLDQYLPYLDDLIISLHMIKGKNGISPIDYLPESFDSELIQFYGSVEEVHKAYWNDVKRLLDKPIKTKHNNKRIGHLGLINKYQKMYPANFEEAHYQSFYKELFFQIKEKGWDLDFNVAGLRKEMCGEVYINDSMLKWCKHFGIKLIYGSDAHEVDSIGRNYDLYLKKVND